MKDHVSETKYDVSGLLADFIKDRAKAEAFIKNANKFLSSEGIEISEGEKTALKFAVKDVLKKTHIRGGTYNSHCNNTNASSHTDETYIYYDDTS